MQRATGRVVVVALVVGGLEPERAQGAGVLSGVLDGVDGAIAEEVPVDALLVDDDAEGVARTRRGREVDAAGEHLDEGAHRRAAEPHRFERVTERGLHHATAREPLDVHRHLHVLADELAVVVACDLVVVGRPGVELEEHDVLVGVPFEDHPVGGAAAAEVEHVGEGVLDLGGLVLAQTGVHQGGDEASGLPEGRCDVAHGALGDGGARASGGTRPGAGVGGGLRGCGVAARSLARRGARRGRCRGGGQRSGAGPRVDVGAGQDRGEHDRRDAAHDRQRRADAEEEPAHAGRSALLAQERHVHRRQRPVGARRRGVLVLGRHGGDTYQRRRARAKPPSPGSPPGLTRLTRRTCRAPSAGCCNRCSGRCAR